MDRRVRVVAVGFAGLLLVAGCSSSKSGSASSATSGPATTSGTSEPTTAITVGTAPTLSGTSFYLATQDGIFAKNHLSATPKVTTSGAEAIPLLLNGQIQFTVSDAVGAIKAISQKLPLEIIAQGPIVSPDPAKDNSGLVVGSSITNVQDLAGKTVAVNALGSFSELAAEKSIDSAGGDSSKVKFVELPIPQMAAAVKAGTVAGAAISEPFLSAAKAEGGTDLRSIQDRGPARQARPDPAGGDRRHAELQCGAGARSRQSRRQLRDMGCDVPVPGRALLEETLWRSRKPEPPDRFRYQAETRWHAGSDAGSAGNAGDALSSRLSGERAACDHRMPAL